MSIGLLTPAVSTAVNSPVPGEGGLPESGASIACRLVTHWCVANRRGELEPDIRQ